MAKYERKKPDAKEKARCFKKVGNYKNRGFINDIAANVPVLYVIVCWRKNACRNRLTWPSPIMWLTRAVSYGYAVDVGGNNWWKAILLSTTNLICAAGCIAFLLVFKWNASATGNFVRFEICSSNVDSETKEATYLTRETTKVINNNYLLFLASASEMLVMTT